jgi:hypothetical protein
VVNQELPPFGNRRIRPLGFSKHKARSELATLENIRVASSNLGAIHPESHQSRCLFHALSLQIDAETPVKFSESYFHFVTFVSFCSILHSGPLM